MLLGCSRGPVGNDTTINESDYSRGVTYEKTAHEYIMLEYFKRYDFSHYKDTIESNSASFVIDGEFDKNLATEFIIKNLHLFTDSFLYSTIVIEAMNKFSFNNPEDFPIAFTSDAKKEIFDYKNEHTGINALQFSIMKKMQNCLAY